MASNSTFLRCTFFHMPPFTFVNQEDPSLSRGVMIDIMKFLMQSLQVSYSISLAREPEHGSEISPGNWTGILGEFMRNESDLAFVPFAPSEYRGRAATFSTAYWFTSFTILSGPPRDFVKNAQTYFSTFGVPVWILILLSYIVMSVLAYVMEKIQATMYAVKTLNLGDHFFFYFGSIFNQGLPNMLPSISSRIIISIWFIALISILNGFSGGFMAKLTLMGAPQKIDSLTDITKYPKLRPLVAKGSVIENYIKNSENPKIIKLFQQIQRNSGQKYHSEFFSSRNMADTLAWKSVLISDLGALLYGIDQTCREGIEYYLSKEMFLAVPIVLAIRKGFPHEFVDDVSYRLIRFSESGLIDTLLKKSFPKADKCGPKPRKDEVRPLTVTDVRPLFYLLMIGLGTSFVSAMMEKCTYSSYKHSPTTYYSADSTKIMY